jgi:hypothetical protein
MGTVDIGHDVQIEVLHSALAGGAAVGLDYTHPGKEGRRCAGFIYFDTPAVRETFEPSPNIMWTVEQQEPLTLSPSLLCKACGHHGFIRDGRWVPAGGGA